MSESNADLKARIKELEAKEAESSAKLREMAQKAVGNGVGEIRFELKATMRNEAKKGQPKDWVIDEGKDCKAILKIDGGYPRSAEYIKNIRLLIQHGATITKGLDAIEKKGLNFSRAKEAHTERIAS